MPCLPCANTEQHTALKCCSSVSMSIWTAATSIAFVKSRFQFRISTILLCIGLLLLPWSSTLLEGPGLPLPGETVRDLIDVMLIYVGPQLFLVAFLFALARIGRSMWQRNWRGAIQPSSEMVLCVLALMLLPTY